MNATARTGVPAIQRDAHGPYVRLPVPDWSRAPRAATLRAPNPVRDAYDPAAHQDAHDRCAALVAPGPWEARLVAASKLMGGLAVGLAMASLVLWTAAFLLPTLVAGLGYLLLVNAALWCEHDRKGDYRLAKFNRDSHAACRANPQASRLPGASDRAADDSEAAPALDPAAGTAATAAPPAPPLPPAASTPAPGSPRTPPTLPAGSAAAATSSQPGAAGDAAVAASSPAAPLTAEDVAATSSQPATAGDAAAAASSAPAPPTAEPEAPLANGADTDEGSDLAMQP